MPEENASATRELRMSRLIDAPRELVWEVWTNPLHLASWWGPSGFSNPECDWDAAAGNKLYVVMQGPDGTRYPMDGQFIEVSKPERLVFTSSALDEKGKPLFEVLNTITFQDKDGKTELNVHAQVSKATPEAEQYLQGMNEGWNQSMVRLTDYTTMNNSMLVFERTLDAPRELVWDAWTMPEHLAKWWGPNGFTLSTHEMNVKPNGIWRFIMHGPDRDYPNKIQYVEVDKPSRLVYRHVDDDDTEGVAFNVTITFEAVDNKTKLTMSMQFPSAGELIHVSRVYGAVQGAHETLARLKEVVAELAEAPVEK